MTERYISPAVDPTPHERELAEVLIEECAEIITDCAAVQQRATKLLRFGPAERQPGQGFDNSERLGLEIGDLMETVDRAIKAGLVSQKDVDKGRERKKAQLAKFLQHTASQQ